MWRLVDRGYSLAEIQHHWDLERVFDANEAIDWRDDVDQSFTLAMREFRENVG